MGEHEMKSKRTKACEIPSKVKARVWERDHQLCVLCGRVGSPVAHFIPRSHNGKGIEQNIVTLCPECHRDYDNSERRPELRKKLRAYLMAKYPDWNEEKLTYRKWKNE